MSGDRKRVMSLGMIAVGGVIVLFMLSKLYTSVPAGHVAVATFFGKVAAEPYEEGFHVVNPLYDFMREDPAFQELVARVGLFPGAG